MSADDDLARELATEAGRRLLDLRGRAGFGRPAALRAAGDRLSHEYLTAALAARRPADAVLSEEGVDDPARLAAQRVWILDPLDGTREFGETGRADWAVHVALWARTGPAEFGTRAARGAAGEAGPGASAAPGPGRLVAGAVALPACGQTFWTGPGGAACGPPGWARRDAEGAPGRPGDTDAGTPAGPAGGAGGQRLRLVVSRSRPPAFVRDVAARLRADLVPLGSAGAKIIAVLTGAADAYLHAGGLSEWDSAAPVAVVQAAGLHASRIDGRPLRYNQPDISQPDILVCRPAIAGILLTAIGSALPARGPDVRCRPGRAGGASPGAPAPTPDRPAQ